MAIRNTQPFYSGGNPTSWPLSVPPYHSRVEDQRVDFEGGTGFDRAKNYQFVAFRPGFSLQASELNEIQEHFQMQLTLSITMMNNWITSGGGFLWNGAEENSPGGVGGGTNLNSFPTSIGLGGGYDGANAFQDQNYQVTAPGWRGATPLYPYSTPYSGDSVEQGRLVTADYFNSGPIGEYVRISFWSGWYLTEVRDVWNGSGPGPAEVSGLKHWVYLDLDTDNTYSQRFTVDIPVAGGSSNDIVAGLVTTSDYYGCCPESESTDLSPCDSTLADNANGVPNSAACGATRYGVNFESASFAIPDGGGVYGDERDQISLTVKVNPQQRTVRYMNNQLLLRW